MFAKEKQTPTFASAMKTFTQAQAELEEAGKANDAALAKAQAQVEKCQEEKSNIDRVAAFFSNLLRGATVDEVADRSSN